MLRRLLAPLMLFLLFAAVTGGVWWNALAHALDRLEERGRADLALSGDRLIGQLQRYREMTVLIAGHPQIRQLAERPDSDPVQAHLVLQKAADITGSDELVVVGVAGQVLASSDDAARAGRDLSDAPSVRRALQGALGFHHEVEPGTGRRLFVYAAPVFSDDGPVLGAVVARIDTEAVEVVWRGEPMIVFFSDRQGTVFVSNRDELILVDLVRRDGGRNYLGQDARRLGGHEIWVLNGGPYLPRRALHLTRPLPVIGMTGEALVDIAPAERQAILQSMLAAAAFVVVGAALYALWERRRALATRLAAEAEANARLETRVAERTRELSQANELLRRTQAELVQAGKLSALGQMSAGISHELNQPLMAIQSYAENAAQFLQRGEPGRAADNLSRIADLARRMGRIIRNLRTFARQESDGMGDVDLVAVVQAALELVEPRLSRAAITVDWSVPDAPVMVRGGEVRLQQVVVNLLSNAADAIGQGGRIGIAFDRHGTRVSLRIRDTGPGIREPERIFDPFYSTKEVGASEGMGLGLSISYSIVKSFGGSISARNPAEGGAEFTVELDAAQGARAA
ncbi:two-component system C4-dicarboxylate transport sensor histidine kinase DctB [Albidovulum inexpectatum]|uniref:C4-dicarboxylate transport sensor protein DctB n=1 Tax=Albidovulum inexpectatum TaxID=196587 RepID=A0A2S5JI46_9RHOB|nr:ATP-binding protein [Albidovulum inexpectatum]PPB81197.1 two-component system C4-dicarboxylate transport sensor histidine kinase DctB [Albidovulum inexpectatum]